MLKDFFICFQTNKKKIVIYKVDIFKLGGNFLKFWESVMYTYNSCQYYCILRELKKIHLPILSLTKYFRCITKTNLLLQKGPVFLIISCFA